MTGLLLLALMASSEPPAPPEPLAPSGRWMVDFAENLCVLQRPFGEGEAEVTFGLRPATLGPSYEIVLLTSDASGGRFRNGKARLAVPADAEPIEANYVSFIIDQGRVTIFHVDWAELSVLTTAETLRIEAGEVMATIAPTNVAAALEVLDSCRRDLIESHGLDLAALAAVAEPATAANPMVNWISTNDYPADALRANQQGTSEILWTIGLDGRAADCRTLVSSGHVSLDRAACGAITRRARYHPARDANGEPIVSWQSRRVRWMLP